MLTVLTLIVSMFIIFGALLIWAIATNPYRVKKPSKKMIQQRQEYIEMIEYKLSRDYVKLKAV